MKEEDKNMATDQNPIVSQMVTLRMLMQGKEVGSIIGKKGDNVKKFREESGAKINISDASCPERIVTVTGTAETIMKAFTMICNKFEEDIQGTHSNNTMAPPLVTLRLIIPASQCGSLIGKGGSKIKEIRECTGASVQVASEMLPKSTERTVTISGGAESITKCIYQICDVMVESPPKGATIPYRPKPFIPPVILAGGQAFAVPQGQYPAVYRADVAPCDLNGIYSSQPDYFKHMSNIIPQPHMAQGALPLFAGGMLFPRPPVAAMAPAMAAHSNPGKTHEMTISNDLIGCIIGKGGAKINEIRQLSGATVKISNMEEGSTDRKVTVTGTLETINTAQLLINACIETHKNMTFDPSMTPSSKSLTSTPSIMSMNPLMKHTVPLMGFNMGLFDNKALTTKIKTGLAPQPVKVDKFSPYQ